MSVRVSEGELLHVYRETIDRLYGYASRKCNGVRELAEDVVQEAWLRAVREWPRQGMPDNPLAWLTTVTRNLVLNDARRQQPVSIDQLTSDDVQFVADNSSAMDFEFEETSVLLHRALAAMPLEEAQVLREFHFERMRMAQLAVRYGTTERAIEGRLRRARERLRRVIEGMGGESSDAVVRTATRAETESEGGAA